MPYQRRDTRQGYVTQRRFVVWLVARLSCCGKKIITLGGPPKGPQSPVEEVVLTYSRISPSLSHDDGFHGVTKRAEPVFVIVLWHRCILDDH